MWSMLRLIWLVIIEIKSNIFGGRRRATSNRQLNGQVVVITGANTGIGKETALQLLLRGAKIYIGCRDLKKGQKAINDIQKQNPDSNIHLIELDLSSLMSVRLFAKQLTKFETKVDILINNAGVIGVPHTISPDGFELHLVTNYLGHYLLTLHLMPLLKQSKQVSARVINISSCGHKMGKINLDDINLSNNQAYNYYDAYAQSKLAQVLFTRELVKRLGDNSRVNVYSLNPGYVHTDLFKNKFIWQNLHCLFYFLSLSLEMGIQTTLYCSLDEHLDNESGFYYDNCRRVKHMVANAIDDSLAHKLWEMSAQLVRLEPEYNI